VQPPIVRVGSFIAAHPRGSRASATRKAVTTARYRMSIRRSERTRMTGEDVDRADREPATRRGAGRGTGQPPGAAQSHRPTEQRPAAVELHVHGDLNDFLPAPVRGTPLRRAIAGRPGVKDVLEAAGVPHPEIALVVVDGVTVGLDHRLQPGDRVDAFPAGAAEPVEDAGAASAPGAHPRFVLDGHLGRLAAYLRMCGFDTLYRRDAGDAELARLAGRDDRILLTRDVGLLKRSIVRRGAFVRSEHPPDQLVEVVRRFGLAARVRPFARCLRCNGCLEPMDRERAKAEVPPRVYREQASFSRCPDCGGIYWRGSHHARMSRLLARTLEAAGQGASRSVSGGDPGRPAATPRPPAP
jgi:uncharacterized protein